MTPEERTHADETIRSLDDARDELLDALHHLHEMGRTDCQSQVWEAYKATSQVWYKLRMEYIA